MERVNNRVLQPQIHPYFLILVVFLVTSAYSQPANLRLEQYTAENGLSNNMVYSIVQDKQGFLWIGTDEGLNRFDGYEFKNFTRILQQTNGIKDNSVHALLVDSEGILWIGTNKGISKYNSVTENFENLIIDFSDSTKAHGSGVSSIKEDSKGNVWVTYLGSGIDVFRKKQKDIVHYTMLRKPGDLLRLKDDYITSIDFLQDSEVILGTRNGLLFIDAEGWVLSETEAISKFPWKNAIEHTVSVVRVSRDKKNVWIGTEAQGVYAINLQTNELRNFITENSALKFNNNVPSLLDDSKGNLWVGGEAIYCFNKARTQLMPYNEFGVPNSVENKNPVLSIYEDTDNNIWFGTYRLGLLKYNARAAQIFHFNSRQGPGSLQNNQILSFGQEQDSTIWVGTDGGGLYKLVKDKFVFEHAKSNDQFSSQVIKSIYRDKNGVFWMGTWEGGMMSYHPKTGKTETYNPSSKNFESIHVWQILEDTNGNFWIATLRNGLCYFNTKDKTYVSYKSNANDSTSLVNNDVLALFLDSDKTLWIGTADGLCVRFDGSNSFKNIKADKIAINAICFYEDSQGRIWIGTNGDGIILTDKRGNVLKRITEIDGLPSSTICAILPDEHKNLWISTYKGMIKVGVNSLEIKEVPQGLGLQGKDFIPRSALKLNNGYMLFGGVNGFNLFHPDSLLFNAPVRKVVFTSFKIQGSEIVPGKEYHGKTILPQSISMVNGVTLAYEDNSFTITFSPLVYYLQNNVYFSYKLENFDPEWQNTSVRERSLHYTNLAPGNYILKIRYSFDLKHWIEIRQFTIEVAPPWWGTIYFRVLIVLLVLVLLYGVYIARVKLLKNQKDKLENLVKIRTKELNTSNEEIRLLLRELAEGKNKIELQNAALVRANNEVIHQRDVLELKSAELENAQTKLQAINEKLELLVIKRTQKLSSTLRELETFLYRASHDLRGPIASMQGLLAVEAMERGMDESGYSERLAKVVLQLDQTLKKLLLKYTIERKKIEYEYLPGKELEKIIFDALKEISYKRLGDLSLQIDNSVKVFSDRMLMKTILVSLLENAFFYSVSSINKKVILKVENAANGFILEVTDFGCGVKNELKERIFEMFYRGNEMSTGNGLGLYLVKSILEKIDGKIEINSQEGVFSTFKIYFVNPN